MGIPSYFSYIVKNHPSIIKKLEKNPTIQINNLYLDCNSIIYDAIHNIDFTKLVESDVTYIIKSVCIKIDEYIRLLKPNKTVFIAFDGVAPVAKLEQQRERRYKSTYQNMITKNIYKDKHTDPWNTTAITPGTKFMAQLNESIKLYYSNHHNYGLENIIVSTSDTFGEGEHKLFQYIREQPEKHSKQTTVIYGLDADLIMLSINHLPISNNIYLFRETPHFIQTINRDLEPNATYLLDIPELAKTITLTMNNDVELTMKQQKNRVYDYIFICFFLGNDFMPHFPSINIRTGGVDKMINAYKATIGNTNENLTDGKTIYWKNVRLLIQYLSQLEDDHLKKEMKLRDKMEKKFLPNETPDEKLKKFEAIPIYERQTEKYINPYKIGWEERYYKILFDVDINEERKKQICVNYLEGLEWTMKYYTSGCPDWRWRYKYSYPPLLKDLIHYVPYFNVEFIINKKENPVSEMVQLCYVLPYRCLHLLPKNLYDGLIKERPEWHKNECDFLWAFCKYFWESHVDMPDIDIDELETFVKEKN